MVDATQATESDFLTADLVKGSKTKKALIMGEGKYNETDFGTRLELPVEIDGKKKQWRPNKDSAKNLQNAWGKDTKSWLGKICDLQVMSIQGKDSIIATAAK